MRWQSNATLMHSRANLNYYFVKSLNSALSYWSWSLILCGFFFFLTKISFLFVFNEITKIFIFYLFILNYLFLCFFNY